MRSCLPPAFLVVLGLPAVQAQPAQVPWDGEWQLLAGESDRVETRIDEHLKGENFARKLLRKRKLRAACQAYPHLDLFLGAAFSVTFGRELPADAPASGQGTWKRSDGITFRTSFRPAGADLVQTLQGKDYTLTCTYALRPDGRTLDLRVTCAEPKEKAPFSYRLAYRKLE